MKNLLIGVDSCCRIQPRLTRDQFRDAVLARSGGLCVICGEVAVDAHHIIERRLFKTCQGYHLANGASVCAIHHIQCEQTTISVESVRSAANITKIIVPDHLYADHIYDKWGNPVLEDGRRGKGELFFDESVQKVLNQGGVLPLFTPYVKQQRTYHLPWSPGVTDDDRMIKNTDHFEGRRVIVTKKMDGENCLSGDTIVYTNIGPMRMDMLCETDTDAIHVLSMNHVTQIPEMQQIIGRNVGCSDDWFDIETESGEVITVTGDHQIYLPELHCYRRARELVIGDSLLKLDPI